jgi:hypothetical protein
MGVLIHPRPNWCPLEMDCTYLFILKIKFYQIHISFIFSYTLQLSVKSCPIGLDPSFAASSPPGCCTQIHEILLNKGMKYWDSALDARNVRTFIATVHIAAAVIGWRRSGKERTVQTQFSTKFAAKRSFMPRWSSVYFFSLFFEISSTMSPNRGFPSRLFLTLRITLICFLFWCNSRCHKHSKMKKSFYPKGYKQFTIFVIHAGKRKFKFARDILNF